MWQRQRSLSQQEPTNWSLAREIPEELQGENRQGEARRGEARLGVCWERANRDKGKVEENEGGFKGTVRRGKLVRVGEEKVC